MIVWEKYSFVVFLQDIDYIWSHVAFGETDCLKNKKVRHLCRYKWNIKQTLCKMAVMRNGLFLFVDFLLIHKQGKLA